ncbi:hypothetical protein K6U06_05785 [Acidiferrimicrobium sp. IK]|uniref:hypothetical protein n=1 Tax=Acidiferrimicrobium sp. IK TaxID=2871700 RepID=UPI0021CB0401|nr:hypothetical protein [Acidiferrimicrobium sp. IK]MCU4183863.1 hypothetical protein [Acidiferrimicrobium sp. IK]
MSGAVGSAAKAAAGDAFGEIANDFAHTAQHATSWLWGQLDQATAVQIGGAGWGTYLGITVTLAVAIGAGLFVIQVIASALRRDMGGMGRALRGLLVAFVAGGAAVGVTEILLQAADAISKGIMQVGLGTSDWQSVGHKFATLSATSYGPATLLLAALFTCAATVLVWLALMVRKVLLILTAVFAPVAFAGSLSDVTAGWVRKWIEYTVALIASKIVLVIVFVVGLGVLMNNLGSTGDSATQQLTQLMAGLLILTVAGLAPWMAVKFVHFTGEAFHTIHSHSGAATGAAASAVAAPQKIRSTANSFGIKSSGGQGRPYTAPGNGTASKAGLAGAGGVAAGAAAEGAKKAKDAAVGQVNTGHATTRGPSASPGPPPAGASRPGAPRPPDDPPAPAGVGARPPQPSGGGSAGASRKPPSPPPAAPMASTS